MRLGSTVSLSVCLSALPAAQLCAQVTLLQPAAASTNMGNFGTYEPFRAIDQSGLSGAYTSGVTELAPFASATHTVSGGSSFTTWFSQLSTTGNYDMDLGGSFLISALVIWADPQNIGQTVNEFTLLADDNAAFTSPINLGTFNCADGVSNATNFGQVFTFAPTTASHVRMVIASNHGSTLTTGFVEVALGVGEDAEPCVADTNNDGTLTPADFSAWIAAFNASAPECDQNGDGLCTAADFSAWIANFNAGC